ncbi:MAG: 7-cyano-7-deazaguanine synthase QueC [Methanomassiliicoccales archaeon]|jgi:7-cyano-7-deazaguanine synthase|nr:7-cyano-7-deazaguanine synthase QueC [Methanomassiliicoccales archaeon]
MKRAIVLLSGGLDSTVTLAYAISKGYEVIPLTFVYGQKHHRELKSAKEVAEYYKLKDHVIFTLDPRIFSSSALVSSSLQIPEKKKVDEIGEGIPSTYVPARNIIFLSIAAGLCETEMADAIFIGANAVDFSGYPDCRPEFFDAFRKVLEVGTKRGVGGKPPELETPILLLTKAEIVKLGKSLGAPLHLTWSCYRGGQKACGRCDSCLLRLKGFREAGFKDEIEYEVIE